jgi:hypothetical protein
VVELKIPIAKIRDNRIIIDQDYIRGQYENFLRLITEKHNGYCAIKLSTPFVKKSTGKGSQTNHFWGHCQSLSLHTGHELREMGLIVLQEALSMGYPASKSDEKILLDRHGFPFPLPISKAGKDDMIIAIEACHKIAAELDCQLIEQD